jgi:hypothetical protein
MSPLAESTASYSLPRPALPGNGFYRAPLQGLSCPLPSTFSQQDIHAVFLPFVDFRESRVVDHSAIEALHKLTERYARAGKTGSYREPTPSLSAARRRTFRRKFFLGGSRASRGGADGLSANILRNVRTSR